MKKFMFVALILVCGFTTIDAQDDAQGYNFNVVKELKITPVKNQSRSGTCWAFSGVGLIEAELLRTGKGEYDFSEMFVVCKNYIDKADKYVRLHGHLNYAQGGSFADVIAAFRDYGAIPESVYPGLEYGDTIHSHSELCNTSFAFLKEIINRPNGKLTTSWKKAHQSIIEAYLGVVPEKFIYKGKEYTPKSFGESLGLNFDDYVSLTSFTHHPFYTQFPIEVEDNWRWANCYNLPIDELMQVFDNAINTGYTIAWGADVSEKGFNRNGIAVMPDVDYITTQGSDQAHWLGLTNAEKDKEIKKLIEKPCKEVEVTQKLRQQAFDNYETTDDHGMLIYGIAKDQNGKKFYMVKNSWGTNSKYNGIWYASETFVKYKTMNIVVHKDALPREIKNKLGIK